jgi:predicted dehydrogenase
MIMEKDTLNDEQLLCYGTTLDVFGEGRSLDTNAEILVKYTNGASGVYWCSQVAVGHDNALKIRIFGTKGSIEWEQENPNYLRVAYLGQPVQFFSRGAGYLYPQAVKSARIPTGHPEGYYEAFANIYSVFSDALQKKKAGVELTEEDLIIPVWQQVLGELNLSTSVWRAPVKDLSGCIYK